MKTTKRAGMGTAAAALLTAMAGGCSSSPVHVGSNDGAGAGSSTGDCTSNAECIDSNGGAETFVCQQDSHTCVNLLSAECPRLLDDPGDLRNDDAVVIGMIWPSSWSAPLLAGENAIELARREFAQAAGGLPGKRPIVVVECDPSHETASASLMKATSHLLDDVKVPVLIGAPLGDVITQGPVGMTVITSPMEPMPMTLSAYVAPLATQAGAAFLTTGVLDASVLYKYGSGGLFTSTLPPFATDDYVVGEVTDLTARTLFTPTDGKKITIKAIDFDSPGENGSDEMYQEGLFHNDSGNQPTGLPYVVGFLGDGLTSLDIQGAATALRDADIVVCARDFCDGPTIAALDKGIGAATTGPKGQGPLYIVNESAAAGISGAVVSNEGLRQRVLGIRFGWASSDPTFVRFRTSFDAAFADAAPNGVTPRLAAEAYDLAYTTFLGMGALGTAPITGAGVGKALRTRFNEGGTALTYQPTDIAAGFAAFSAGQRIDAKGALGSGDFDSSGDLTHYQYQIWCVDPDASKIDRVDETGLYYDSDSKSLKGTLACPGG